jgi:hypothetical protein
MKQYFDIMFKIEPYRNQELKPEASKSIKKSSERNKDLTEVEIKELEEEEKRKEEAKKEANELLRLGHEKLLLSCLGLGFTNLTKTLI